MPAIHTCLLCLFVLSATLAPCFAQAASAPGTALNAREQGIIPIAAFTASGELERLKPALADGLAAGLTVNEIKEVLVQLYAYAGFPRCLNGLGVFTALLEERKAQGIRETVGREATPIPPGTDVRARGKEIQTKVSGREVKGGVFDFAPVVNEYLQAHLFGDIFLRDVLTFEERELATVAALAALGVEPQLRSHLNAAMNVGVSAAQLRQVVEVLRDKVGAEAAERASRLLEAVLEARGQKEHSAHTNHPQQINQPQQRSTTMTTPLITLLLAGAALFAVQTVQAADDANANPFGLVYRGAISKNEPGRVNIHPVNYQLRDITVAANVYTPANYDASKKYPAVVVAHPNGGVKEQVAGLYAQRLAERGYIAIAADAAYQGASSGEPRNVDRPAFRIDDIRGMADYIGGYPGADAERLALLGICGGGGYALKAAQTDKRFKAVATLSLFDSGRVRRNGFLDADKANIQKRLQEASKARAEFAATGKATYLGSKPGKLTAEELAKIPTDLYRDGMEYYGDTHAHPNSTFAYTADSLLDLMAFDATSHMDLIDQPLLIMAGDKADTLYMSEDAFAKATGTANKELFKIPGATHIRTYWVPEYVNQAMDKLGEFYGKNL